MIVKLLDSVSVAGYPTHIYISRLALFFISFHFFAPPLSFPVVGFKDSEHSLYVTLFMCLFFFYNSSSSVERKRERER